MARGTSNETNKIRPQALVEADQDRQRPNLPSPMGSTLRQTSMTYSYQFDAHVQAWWEEIIDKTEAESVAHVLGTYY